MTDRKKVWICINEDEVSRDVVLQDLEDEGYPYFFHTANNMKYVNGCDEFWCFGNCEDMETYKKAKELGKDIWQMM